MIERRRHHRSRAFRCGTVTYRLRAASHCVVRDVSEGGAMLMLADAGPAAAEVELDMPPDGGPRWARVVWRAGATVGVVFARPPAAPDPARSCTVLSLDAARRARPVASEDDRLAERIAQVTKPRTGARPFWMTVDANR